MKPSFKITLLLRKYTLVFWGLACCLLVISCNQKQFPNPIKSESFSTPIFLTEVTPTFIYKSQFTLSDTYLNRPKITAISATPALKHTETVLPTVTTAIQPTIYPTMTPTPLPTFTQSAHSPLIAFTMVTQDGKEAIYTIHPDGTNLTYLETGQLSSYSPSWSPSGQMIAYLNGDSLDTAN